MHYGSYSNDRMDRRLTLSIGGNEKQNYLESTQSDQTGLFNIRMQMFILPTTTYNRHLLRPSPPYQLAFQPHPLENRSGQKCSRGRIHPTTGKC
jgi:hypothetical protein